jgi:hypothetical protein
MSANARLVMNRLVGFFISRFPRITWTTRRFPKLPTTKMTAYRSEQTTWKPTSSINS